MDYQIIISAVITLLTGAIIALVGLSVKQYGKENILKIFEIAKVFVKSAEQLGKLYGYDYEKKREIVMRDLKKTFPHLSEIELEKYMEAAVLEMNKAKEVIVAEFEEM